MYKRTFWNNVRSLLIRDLNQTWLAKEVGISPNTLSMMISRNSLPKADVAHRISIALGVPLATLLNEEEEAYPNQHIVKEHSHALYGGEEEPSFLIPLTSPILTYEEENVCLSAKNYIGSVRVLKRMANNYKPEDLVGVRVVEDGMKDMNLDENDIAIFAKGHISSNGLYAISLRNNVQIKRLEFNLMVEGVTILSENPHYGPLFVKTNNNHFKILGKLVGWIHVLS
jgi:transcriptional regulator with XRE-family HTH domain